MSSEIIGGAFDPMMFTHASEADIDSYFGEGTYIAINEAAGGDFNGLNTLAMKEGLSELSATRYTDRQLIAWIANKRRNSR